MLRRASVLLCLTLAACDTVEPPQSPPSSSSQQNVIYSTNVFSRADPGRDPVAFVDARAASEILVLQSTKLDRPAEVVGIVDVHEPMTSEAAALARLREKAAALGANAIVGVEFHHGEAAGEPTHLSGLAVRFRPTLADVN
jgi:hypothetical protein